MFIQDIENFPVVKISYQSSDQISLEENIARFEALLDRQQAFVLLGEGPAPEQQASHEERKFVAAWVKQKRSNLAEFVKALVHIETDEQSRLLMQKFANNYVKFAGYPMFVVTSQQQAQQIIRSVLKY